jgi:aminopeptidase N
MEKASGRDLTKFFDQWLHRGGMIRAQGEWNYDAAKKQMVLKILQQGEPYTFPLEVAIHVPGVKSPVVKKLNISKQGEQFSFPVSGEPMSVELDPRKVLLAEMEVTRKPGN